MRQRTNYYKELDADYSKPGLVDNELVVKLLQSAEAYISLREETLPDITLEYSLAQVEKENKDWWPTHCAALQQGRGDILAGEYANELVYLCADGPFYGRTAGTNREANWWAILAQPNVTTAWPIVIFHSEAIYCEWKCTDDETNETIAKGNETLLRRGHRGACYLKSEQLAFYCGVYAAEELLYWIRR